MRQAEILLCAITDPETPRCVFTDCLKRIIDPFAYAARTARRDRDGHVTFTV